MFNLEVIIYLTLNCIELSLIILLVAKNLKSNVASVFSEPIYLAVLASTIIHIVVPLLQFLDGYYRYQYDYAISTHIIGNFTYLATLVFVLLGYKLGWRERTQSTVVHPVSTNASLLIWIIVFFPAIWVSLNNLQFINKIGQLNYLSDRIGFGAGRGVTLLFANNIYIALLFAFSTVVVARKFRKSWMSSFALLILAVYVPVYYFYTGERNSLFIVFLSLILVWLGIKQKVSIRRIATIFPVVILIGLLLAYAGEQRQNYVAGQRLANLSIDTFVKGINGAFGNHENVLWLIENDHQLSFGQTYAAAFTNFIPRSLWKDKPVGGGPVLKNMVAPGSYEVGREGNSSLTTGFITEAMMNFGLFGLPFVSLLYGWLLAVLRNRMFLKSNSFDLLLQVTIILSFSFTIFYAEFLGLIARLILTTMPLVLVKWFIVSIQGVSTLNRGSAKGSESSYRLKDV